jgi:hypothetical protein
VRGDSRVRRRTGAPVPGRDIYFAVYDWLLATDGALTIGTPERWGFMTVKKRPTPPTGRPR